MHFNEEEEMPNQSFHNTLLLELARLIAAKISGKHFLDMLQPDAQYDTAVLHQLKAQVLTGCYALYKKVYLQFVTCFQEQVTFTLQ